MTTNHITSLITAFRSLGADSVHTFTYCRDRRTSMMVTLDSIDQLRDIAIAFGAEVKTYSDGIGVWLECDAIVDGVRLTVTTPIAAAGESAA